MAKLPRMLLVQFLMQLVHLHPRLIQGLPAKWRNRIDSPSPPANILQRRLQQPAPLKTMQKRVQRPRPNLVAVVRKLFHHREPKNRLVSRMHKHVDPNQPEK